MLGGCFWRFDPPVRCSEEHFFLGEMILKTSLNYNNIHWFLKKLIFNIKNQLIIFNYVGRYL